MLFIPMRRALCGLLALMAVAAAIIATRAPAYAQNLVCSAGGQCSAPVDFVWRASSETSVVSPAAGGSIIVASNQGLIQFPPNAVNAPLTVSAASTVTPAAPLGWAQRGLGFFTLTATDSQGVAYTRLLAPWTATFTYAECPPNAPCMMSLVDEASLHCERLDTQTGAWQHIPSVVDVFANQVTCSSDQLGAFALVAGPLVTSSVVDQTNVFLPLVQ